MVNTLSLPVVVPHGDDDSDVYVLYQDAAALQHAARQRTRLTNDATTQTQSPAASLRRNLCCSLLL